MIFGFRNYMLLEGEPDAAPVGALGGEPASATPGMDPNVQAPDAGPEISWPEGFEDGLKGEGSLKPFIKEGQINYANLMKSYVHNSKMVGADTVTIPNENWDDSQRDDFWGKLGATKDVNEIKFNQDESKGLTEDIVNKVKSFAVENRVPAPLAEKMLGFLDQESNAAASGDTEAKMAQITEGLDSVKKEWGQAYSQKLSQAQRVLTEVVKDDSVMEAMKNPEIGSNPAILKTLAAIGAKLFGEDSAAGTSGTSGADQVLSPSEAKSEIGRIMADSSHPYHLPDHLGHSQAVSKVQKLFEMKRG